MVAQGGRRAARSGTVFQTANGKGQMAQWFLISDLNPGFA
jgi:hypothetical protein